MSAIRPSNLPKLAQCAAYESQPFAGAAAARGTKLDELFRAVMAGKTEVPSDVSNEEIDAVSWAVETIRGLAKGEHVETAEENCRLTIPGFEKQGTADALCAALKFGADLKSGQIRNYMEQMAAYALACMEAEFVEEWTMYLLFCDQKRVIEHHFTLTEAARIVQAVVKKASEPDPTPKRCEYCKWCNKVTTCPANVDPANEALAVSTSDFDAVLEDPARLSAFLLQCDALDGFRKKAEEKARELLAANPAGLAGWKLKPGAVSSVVDPGEVGKWIQKLGFGPVLDAFGPMSAKKFKEIWEKQLPHDPFPETAVRKKAANKPTLSKA